jgi:hypothetical protein
MCSTLESVCECCDLVDEYTIVEVGARGLHVMVEPWRVQNGVRSYVVEYEDGEVDQVDLCPRCARLHMKAGVLSGRRCRIRVNELIEYEEDDPRWLDRILGQFEDAMLNSPDPDQTRAEIIRALEGIAAAK